MMQRVSVVAAAVFSVVGGVSSVHAEDIVEPAAPSAPSAPATPEAPRPPPAAPQARVHIRSTKSGLVVARITERVFMVGAGGSASGIAWKDICMAPCEFALEPGLHELMLKGDGLTPLVRQLQLAPGDHYFLAKPGSSGLRFGGYTLALLGLVVAATGATFLFLPQTDELNLATMMFEKPEPRKWPLPLLLGGLGATGLGIGMFIVGRSSFETEAGPQVGQGELVRRAISYRTSF